jgi:hypothetical protein
MSSNAIPIDLNYEKLRLLLRRLSQGVIEIDEAQELNITRKRKSRCDS